jgi:hypothetical protein
VHTRAGIADRRPHIGGRAIREAGYAHSPAHRLGDGFKALVVAIGTVGAEAFDGGVDQARVERRQHLVAQSEAIEGAGAEVLNQHVRLGNHLLEEFLSLGALQIEGQALLVGVEEKKKQAVTIGTIAHIAAGHVAALRFLELDHFRTEEAQHLGARGSRLIVGHVDDADTCQGLSHVRLPHFSSCAAP